MRLCEFASFRDETTVICTYNIALHDNHCSILEDGILHLSESVVAPLLFCPRTPSVHSETWGVMCV